MELNKQNMKKLLFLISFGLVLFWALYHSETVLSLLQKFFALLAPFLYGLCFAFVINVLLRPLERAWEWLWKKRKAKIAMRLKRPLCLLLSVLIILGAVFVLLFMVVPEVKKTAELIIESYPSYVQTVTTQWGRLQEFAAGYEINLPQPNWNVQEISETVKNYFAEHGSAFLDKTVDITSSIFSAVLNAVLGMVFAFYILAQKESLRRQLNRILRAFLSPQRVKAVEELAAVSNRQFNRFVTGQLTEALIIGGMCFIGMSVLSIPYAPMISVLLGFAALIPVFGAILGTVLGAFLILMVDPMKALWFVIFIIVMQQVDGNLIYPRVVGKSVGLPGMWVLAAVTVGGSAMGVLGMLLSVPVCSVLYCLFKQTVQKRLDQRDALQTTELQQEEAEHGD